MKGLRIVTLFALMLGWEARASEPLQLVTLEYPPYIEVEEGQVSGVATEVVAYIFYHLDVPVEITVLPWARALNMVKRGRADAIFTAFKNPERETFADYSQNVLFLQNISLMSLAERNYDPEEVLAGDASSITLCVVNGVSYGKRMDKKIATGEFKLVFQKNSMAECAHLVRTKRADLWVNNEFGARSVLVTEGLEQDIKVLTPAIEATPSYIAFSKARQHQALVAKFDSVLSEMKRDGRYESMIYDYFARMRESHKNQDIPFESQ
ncbi:substrate-binding periplasmic protein [Vibrio ostreicida]|uniref:substrate-binding periplasmic protein n=1 Tax=Vibrio ostreicida TaxID=526588 RepID=UPI000970DBBB|nr:transporter substrate-binding domain-containing protein [Vibrio ostreicida]